MIMIYGESGEGGFKEYFCMFFFVVRGLKKDRGYLFKSLVLCRAGKICVAVPCLGFPCKCGKEIFFGSAAFKVHKVTPDSIEFIHLCF